MSFFVQCKKLMERNEKNDKKASCLDGFLVACEGKCILKVYFSIITFFSYLHNRHGKL